MSKRVYSSLLRPRSIIFGLTSAYFIYALLGWLRGPVWDFHREVFVATVLLTAALGLVINKPWGNLLAAVLSGQLPFALLSDLWMWAQTVEVPVGSSQHVESWIHRRIDLGGGPMLWLILSAAILACAASTIIRSPVDCCPSHDV